jgi:hypothetical protein
MNAIEDTRQLFNARLETLEAKIDGKLAMIFQRLDAMPDRAEMHTRPFPTQPMIFASSSFGEASLPAAAFWR